MFVQLQVCAYEARRFEAESQGKKFDTEPFVRPHIKLFSCLEMFAETELVEQFFSTAINSKTTARKYVLSNEF